MNKGVLFFIISLLVIPAVISQVEIKEFVNDYAGILDAQTKTQLDSSLKQIYDSGIAQYSIVTIKSLEGKDIESYSLNLAQGNLGATDKNNGLLLLISFDDKQYRFEVGRGIEYILNDAKIGRIGRNYLVPNFRTGDYSKGILDASLAVKSILLGDNSSEYYIGDEEYDESIVWSNLFIFLITIFIFFFLPIIINYNLRKKNKDKYFNAATGAIILFGGRGGHGGFGGGGFGGFGGGGFGGGGASGGW